MYHPCLDAPRLVRGVHDTQVLAGSRGQAAGRRVLVSSYQG